MVGRPSQRSKSGQKSLLEVRKWSGGTSRGPGLVERPSRRSYRSYGSGREAVPEVRVWSGSPRKGTVVVRSPFWRSGRGR